jgi:hypothetical protein
MAAITFTSPTRYTPQRRLVVRVDPSRTLRRRRLAAALLLLAIAGSLAVAVALATRHASPPSGRDVVAELSTQTVASSVHVVQPGETLWTIAREAQPTGDVRPLVQTLAAQLGGRPLQPGQRIALPAIAP